MNIRDLIRTQIDTLDECLDIYCNFSLINGIENYSFSEEHGRIKEKIKKLRFELFKEYGSSLWIYIKSDTGFSAVFSTRFDKYYNYNKLIDTAFKLSRSVYVIDNDIKTWFDIKQQLYVPSEVCNINNLEVRFVTETDLIKNLYDMDIFTISFAESGL